MMRVALNALLVLSLTACGSLPRAHARDALELMQQRIIEVGETVTPSVVHIEAVVKVNNRRNMVTGSGVLMDAEGTVLTNEHVVERAEWVTVVVPGRTGRYSAEVAGTDKQTDLAVLRIEPREGEKRFPAAKLGDSERVRVGEWVIAIGNPYGLDGTVSLGIVSAKGRNLQGDDLLNEFIQTDAMIDRGSSGGPLVNLRSEVVGINSRGQGRGIGFTIPINTAKRVVAELHGGGQIARGYLGVSLQPLDRELARYWGIPDVHGVVINGVVEKSPAESVGLQAGDIITGLDGDQVEAEKDEDLGRFQRLVAMAQVGKEVDLRILRGGEARTMRVRLGTQPKVVPDEEETEFGFTVQEVTERLVRRYRLDRRDGVLVSFVERGSEGAEAGLVAGDLILRIGELEVAGIQSFREILGTLDPDRPLLIEARRGSDMRYMLIVPRKPETAVESRAPRRPTGG
jgi:S1-C subfamily serine protease